MDHLLLRQLPTLLRAVGDFCYSPSGATTAHALGVAFWLVADTVYNSLLLAMVRSPSARAPAPLRPLWAFSRHGSQSVLIRHDGSTYCQSRPIFLTGNSCDR